MTKDNDILSVGSIVKLSVSNNNVLIVGYLLDYDDDEDDPWMDCYVGIDEGTFGIMYFHKDTILRVIECNTQRKL